MRHAFAHRMLFGLVVAVVVTLPFLFHRGGGDDASTGSASQVMAAALVDPYVQQANEEALAEGRATTLADVEAVLPSTAAGQDPAPDVTASGIRLAAPTFTVTPDRIAAVVSTLGAPVTCDITISGGKAVTRC
jgi:hypothetical protein